MTAESAAPVYQAGQWVEGPRRLKTVTTYDPSGKQIEFANYDRAGSLDYRMIFSYDANGTETGTISFSKTGNETGREVTVYNPSERTVTWSRLGANGMLKKEVLTTYDAQGKETERIVYSGKPGTEEILLKHSPRTYSKDGLLLEELTDFGEGLQKKTLFAYDPQGNLIQSKELSGSRESSEHLMVTSYYTYEHFDTHGNWTKRIMREARGLGHDQFTVEYRTFTYH